MSRPRRWLVVEARSPEAEPDDGRLVEGLLGLGGGAVQEREGWLVTHVDPAGLPDEGLDHRALTAGLRHASGMADLEVRCSWQEQEDWDELWKRGLEPRRVTPRLVVTPSWCDPDTSPGDLVVTLDPGVAFGNAEHGTTRGCMRLMDGVVAPGQRVLDVGSGSGILSIVAALLGAERVLAVEADPMAVETARENLSRNGVADRVELRERRVDARELEGLGPFQGVVANLEWGVLQPLLAGVAEAAGPGAWIVLAGILETQWDEVVAGATALGLVLEADDADGEWRSGRFRKP